MSTKLPDIKTHFADWYQDIVYRAELADQAPVRGCIVVRPYGWAIWELIRDRLDLRIKQTGHQNAAFPLLIPESFFKKEAEHIEGFAPELAVVTIAGGKELEEPLVVRPTSETIIHYSFARWVKSWRDLPIKINQWGSVVRWEMRARPFLRTTEFYWHEGHTVHETKQEAIEEVELMLKEFVQLAQDFLAIPVISGVKSEQEKFAGADKTMTFEGIMQDGKALQMGTSHLISQNFAKAFEIQFQDRNGTLAYPYLTSWCGATTRLIGALVMVHGDQKGLVLPPLVAPIQLVIVPIFKKGEDSQAILDVAYAIKNQLKDTVRVHIDADQEKTPGSKFYEWETKGVPLRLELGPRDIASNQVVLVDRIGSPKQILSMDNLHEIPNILKALQKSLFDRAFERRKQLWHQGDKLVDFGDDLANDKGFYQTGFCGMAECEQKLKEYKASTRCFIEQKTHKECFACNMPSVSDVIVARSY